MNVYHLGENKETEFLTENKFPTKYEDYSLHNCRDFIFQKTSSNNMDKLWNYFHRNETYPEFYLGIAYKMAICKCPQTGKEHWYNGKRCLQIENPKKGTTVTVEVKIKNRIYRRDFIFMGWVQTPVHEWRMKKGTTLKLEQRFVDGLLPQDKRYLQIIK